MRKILLFICFLSTIFSQTIDSRMIGSWKTPNYEKVDGNSLLILLKDGLGFFQNAGSTADKIKWDIIINEEEENYFKGKIMITFTSTNKIIINDFIYYYSHHTEKNMMFQLGPSALIGKEVLEIKDENGLELLKYYKE